MLIYKIVMCAIGSGVSPFIGMIHHKFIQSQNSLSNFQIFRNMRLIYGFRKREDDCIETEFLEEMVANGVLNELDCIESHNSDPRYYVQHYLADNSHIIENEMLKDSTTFYACGLGN